MLLYRCKRCTGSNASWALFTVSRKQTTSPWAPHANDNGWPHANGELSLIQVLRQKIHQLERTSAIDYLVDQITLTARQLLDHALRRGPDGFVGPMDTCREQQHERGVSEVHGKTQNIGTAVYRNFSFSYQPTTKRCLAVSIFRLPHKGKRGKRTGKGRKGMGTQG